MATEKIAFLLALLSFIALLSKLSLLTTRGRAMSDKPAARWSELDITDLRLGLRGHMSVSDIAGYLLRSEEDVREKARELGLGLNFT